MTSSVDNNPSKQKIQQLLAAVGIESEEDSRHNIDAYDHNWDQCRYFSENQLEKLDNFTAKVAQNCAEEFTQLYSSDFNVTIDSTAQHFAQEFSASNSAQGDYCLTFTTDQNQLFGLVGIPAQTATAWTTQLLGDSKPKEDSIRDLSQLEQSLLLDIASCIIKGFSKSYDNHDFQLADVFIRAQKPVELQDIEQLCKITFSTNKTDSEDSYKAYFLILCDKLLPAIGENTQDQILSKEDISNAMLSHVHHIPVSVTANLGSTVLTFEEIINLNAGDILLLDKKIDEPIELIAENQIFFYGRPAKSAGKYAVIITEIAYDKY